MFDCVWCDEYERSIKQGFSEKDAIAYAQEAELKARED